MQRIKELKELKKIILNNIENNIIDFTVADTAEINAIKVEEIDDDTTIIYI